MRKSLKFMTNSMYWLDSIFHYDKQTVALYANMPNPWQSKEEITAMNSTFSEKEINYDKQTVALYAHMPNRW